MTAFHSGPVSRKAYLYAIILIALAVFGSACGYRSIGQSTVLPEAIRAIAVPVFKNDSTEPGIGATVTRAVIEKFERDGRLRITSRGEADAVLAGTVATYSLRPIAYDSTNNATEYRVKITVRVRFEDKTGGAADSERSKTAQSDYSVGESIVQAEIAREEAIISSAEYIGDWLVGYLLEGF